MYCGVGGCPKFEIWGVLLLLFGGHRSISFRIGCLDEDHPFAKALEGAAFPSEPYFKGRSIDPDITEESQLLALEEPSLVKTGFMMGKQALMTPRRASRSANSPMRLYLDPRLEPLISVVIFIRTIVIMQILMVVNTIGRGYSRASVHYAQSKHPTQHHLLASGHLQSPKYRHW